MEGPDRRGRRDAEDPAPKAFYPDYLFEVLVVVLLVLELAAACAIVWPAPLGRPVNLEARYDPRPEWYFLWIYQLVRYFQGRWVALGTVGIPLAAFGVLLSLPFVDRSGRPGGRALAAVLAGLLFLGVLGLTLLALF